MPQRIIFRKIRAEEIDSARLAYKQRYDWAPEPNWDGVWVRIRDGKIVGMFEPQIRPMVFLLDADTPADAFAMIERADTYFAAMGVNQYEFTVPDHNERMQSALEKHYGLEPAKELPHKLYIVRRD